MKNLVKGMVALFAGVAFAACSKTDLYDENYVVDNLKSQYKANFEKKYGTIDPNQSWDFTNFSNGSKARTRGVTFQHDRINLASGFWSFIANDKATIEQEGFISGLEEKDWEPNKYLAVELYPCFTHGSGITFSYMCLGVCVNGTVENISANIKVKNNNWYEGGTALNHDSGRDVNTKDLVNVSNPDVNVYWVAYPYWSSATSGYKKLNEDVQKNISAYKITKYKEFELNGRTYWCFNCDNDENSDYRDLICLVRNVDPVKRYEKRYMIEDLGATDDFDFNDIVVDVKQDLQGNQKAIIRAMGGTIDFTLKIGKTTWTKSVDGAPNYVKGTMYNTTPQIGWDDVLAEFDVEGWVPDDNNIEVTVKENKDNGVITVIPFPKEGEAPMIIAVDPFMDWMPERVSLPSNWYIVPEEAQVTE